MKFHRLVPVSWDDGIDRFRVTLYKRSIYLRLEHLIRFSDTDIYYYYDICNKYIHVFYINLNKLNYETKEKEKISSRPSA